MSSRSPRWRPEWSADHPSTGDGTGPLTVFFPVSLDLGGRSCLVVGGGPVAARKVKGLLECDAVVTVIAPEISDEMTRLAPLTIERRPYAKGDAKGFRLVITATGLPAVDGAVYADADAGGVWVNSADDLAHCTFIMPSVHRDGPVTVAISTGGTSPALATWLRLRLAQSGGPGLGELAQLLGQARQRLHDAGRSTEQVDWAALLNGPLPALVEAGRHEQARVLIEGATGIDLAP
jgi:siroheme synthase-like protein